MAPTEKSSIKVKWEGLPEEFSKEKQARIEAYFRHKYKCKNVIVEFNPVMENGSQYTLDKSENIYDLANQRKLVEQFITENQINVNIDDIMRLDDKVNEKMKSQKDTDYTYRKLKIKRIWFDNFLSFGSDNEFPIEELNNITVINSFPPNYGGKTILAKNLITYLFFNKTDKTKRDIEIFNIYCPEKNQVNVKGLIEINNEELIIERTITRSGKTKITTNSQLRIAKLINGVEENLSEEQRRISEKFILDSIGTYNDFLLTIIADANSLENLIEQQPTERGTLLTRFIGLDIIKEKEEICKSIKCDWEKNIKSNQYNIVDLSQENELNNTTIAETELLLKESDNNLKTITSNIHELDLTKEVLIGKKKPIDDSLLGVDIEEEKNKLQTIINNGKDKKEQYQKLKEEFKTRIKPEYDESGHNKALQLEKELVIKVHEQSMIIGNKEKEIVNLERAKDKNIQDKEKEIVNLERAKDKNIQDGEASIINIERTNERSIQEKEKLIIAIKMEHNAIIKSKEKEIVDLNKLILDLKDGEICPTCKRKFDNCDNSATIIEHESSIINLTKEIDNLKKIQDPRIDEIQKDIDGIKNIEDPEIAKIRNIIKQLKETESPEIIKLQLQIKKLKDADDPIIVLIKNEIKNITEIIIPKIESDKIKNNKLIEDYKQQNVNLNQYDKDEIKLERLGVEVKNLAQEYKEQDDLIKRHEQNTLAININKEIEKEIIDVNFKKEIKGQEKDTIIRNQQIYNDKIKKLKQNIEDTEKLITIINKEQEILKIFEHYLVIFGKKGITSLIFKSAIPLINSELDRLLNDTATFSMELDLNIKNDVEYWMIDRETGLKKLVTSGSGYELTASALALRAVLTKVSVLPKPDIIVLDEVFGKVADENLELMKFLIDKISLMFDKVFIITHNPLVSSWATNIVTVFKENNISRLVIK